MEGNKEKLMQMLLIDIQHWSVDALEEAFEYADDKCLDPGSAEDLRWWWNLRKAVRFQLDKKRLERK